MEKAIAFDTIYLNHCGMICRYVRVKWLYS